MLKQISKVVFWSALAFFFYFFFGFSVKTYASDPKVTISEVYYNPLASDDTGAEWVKIYNPNEASFSLEGYDLYTGKYYTFKNFVLEPKKSVIVHINLVGLDTTDDLHTGTDNQTNMGDSYGTVALFKNQTHSSATIIDFVQFGSGGHTWQSAAVSAGIWTAGDFVPKTEVGHSMKLINIDTDNNLSTDWVDNIILLPVVEEDENTNLSDEENISQVSIAEARQKKAGEYVSITGVVTVLPGKLSDQYFYIQDDTAGIQIYCNKKDFPEIQIGSLVQVTGQVGDYYTDKRLKISGASDIAIIGQKDTIVPAVVEIPEIDDSKVGLVVEFEAEVSSTSGNTFYVEDGTEIKVNIHDQTDIDKPRMAVGDKVRIVGIVAKYKNTYQVLPFEQAGVTILTSGKLPVGGKSGPDFSKSILLLSLWKLSPKAKKRLKNLLKTMPKV